MEFEIVPAESTDIDGVLDCWVDLVEGQRSYGSHIKGKPNETVARSLIGQYAAGDMLDIARSKGETEAEVLGFVMYYLEEGLYEQSVVRGVIENVYVRPYVRGHGVGSALLSRAETALSDRGAEVVALTAMAENEDAIELYKERGYAPQRIVLERSLTEE